MRNAFLLACAAAGLVIGPRAAEARQGASAVPPQYGSTLQGGDTVLATPVARYPAGALHRWVLGRGWRELWATPVRAPVLDLGTFAGGLTPLRLGGGQQTRSLRFRGADGVEYSFRSIDKDVSRGIDPILRESLAQDVLQDQVSALFPLSSAVVAPLLDAVGILNPRPVLVVMPDDPALGEFREGFRGLLGWMEIRPDEGDDDLPGFAGSGRVVGSDRLFERLEEDAENRINAPAVLRARLMDMLVGDWDRHPDQWRWAGFETGDGLLVFEPVPRDRDWALTRLDGLLSTLTRVPWPYYLGFDTEYASAFRQSWNGRGIDRRLLVSLDREAVRAVATDLQARLTDAVIDDAVGRLPAPYQERVGPWLTQALRNRRDGLVALADDHYLLHAGWVDVDTTDEDEVATVERLGDGTVRVRVELADPDDAPEAPVVFERLFRPDETREVRLYLRGGDDVARVTGTGEGPIRVRVVGGGADDRFIDETPGHRVHFYDDERDDDVFEPGPATSMDRRRWQEPEDAEAEVQRTRPRDWGSRWIPLPEVSYDPDLGVFLGMGARRTAWAFRRHPWADRLDVAVGVGTGRGTARGRVEWETRLGVDEVWAGVRLSASGAEVGRFYGYGNDTPELPDDSTRARWSEVRGGVGVALGAAPGAASGLRAEAGVEWARRRSADDEGMLLDRLRPYGYGSFAQVALRGRLTMDRRDDPDHPRHGVYADLDVRWVPEALDVRSSYVTVRGEVRGYLSADESLLRPSLALRVGGERVEGTAPWFDAAFLGGRSDLRGHLTHRFAGDAAVWGNAELRLFLGSFLFLLPGDFGVLGLADAGRVRVDGDSPGDWHTAVGGGVWARWIERYTATLSVATSRETTAVYLGLGWPF